MKRFMELIDILSEFLDDKPCMTMFLTVYGKTLVSYLADIFEKTQCLK